MEPDQGIGFARSKNEEGRVGVIAELPVETQGGAIDLERVKIAADAGRSSTPMPFPFDRVLEALEARPVT